MSFSIADLAGEPQTNQSATPQASKATPTSAATPDAGTFSASELGGVEAENKSSTVNQSRFAPYNAAAFGRYTTPENYEKWASTQPKTGPDAKPGEFEAWTSANTPGGYKETLKTIPVAAAETLAGITGAYGLGSIPELAALAGPFAEHISSQILEHGTELATKYPNFVKLAGKLVPHIPLSTLAAVTWAYEHFKK